MKSIILVLVVASMVLVTIHTVVRADPLVGEHFQPDVIVSSTSAGPQNLELTSLLIAPSEPRSGEQFTVSFALYNPTGEDITISRTGIGLRGPDACAPENPWTANMPRPQPEEWRDHVVRAGETRWFIRDYATYLAPGHYIIEPVYYCDGCSNNFPPFNNSHPLWFDVLNSDYSKQIPNCLIVTEPLTIYPSNPSAGQDVHASFTLRNNSSRTIVFERVLAAGRYGDSWAAPNADFPDAPNQPVSLQPGSEFHYSGIRTFSEEGRHFAEPWRKEAGAAGGYYTGGIWGGNRAQFSVSTSCPGQYRAEYFGNSDLAGEPVFTQCENWPIDHDWGYDGPGYGIPSNTFSVRWTGRATLEETFYDFFHRSDDAMRAWLYWAGSPVDSPNLFNNWDNPQLGDQTYSRAIRPTTEYEIIVEYANRDGFAEAKFRWEARPRIGQIQGQVIDENGAGIVGVHVSTASTSRHDWETGPDGSFTFSSLPIRTQYEVYVSKDGYVFNPSEQSVFLENSDAANLTFTGTSSGSPSGAIIGRVTDTDENALSGVTINAKSGDLEYTVQTQGSDAIYSLDNLPPGVYTVTPTKANYMFGPASKTVTVPSFEANFVTFLGIPCTAPSGLDVCDLQPGDILLKTSRVNDVTSVDYWWPIIGGTYFSHAALYLGVVPDLENPEHVSPHIAEAQGDVPGDEDDVWAVELTTRPFWTGQNVMDWAVVRPPATASEKESAIAYALDKANAKGVTFLIDDGTLRAPDINDETTFYCSKLVWKSYDHAGVKVNKRNRIGDPASRLGWVTPEDLYWGSPEVQSKKADSGRKVVRGIFSIWSPAHLTLIDPQNRRSGFNPDGLPFDEIPDALYSGPDAVVESINVVDMGDNSGWQIITTGYDTGDYELELGFLDPTVALTAIESSTEPGLVHTYDVPLPGYSVYLPLVIRE